MCLIPRINEMCDINPLPQTKNILIDSLLGQC